MYFTQGQYLHSKKVQVNGKVNVFWKASQQHTLFTNDIFLSWAFSLALLRSSLILQATNLMCRWSQTLISVAVVEPSDSSVRKQKYIRVLHSHTKCKCTCKQHMVIFFPKIWYLGTANIIKKGLQQLTSLKFIVDS